MVLSVCVLQGYSLWAGRSDRPSSYLCANFHGLRSYPDGWASHVGDGDGSHRGPCEWSTYINALTHNISSFVFVLCVDRRCLMQQISISSTSGLVFESGNCTHNLLPSCKPISRLHTDLSILGLLGLIFAMEWLVDRMETVVNITSDSVGAGILDTLYRDKINAVATE